MAKLGKSKNVSLTNGRPPLRKDITKVIGKQASQGNIINARKKSSKATRTLINAHHQIQKSRAAAVAAKNENLVKELDEQIQQLGGLEAYQAASLTGQDKDRGGDSSEKLVAWLREYGLVRTKKPSSTAHDVRVLEIGALSSRNAISSMIGQGINLVKRVDLHSQEPDLIEEIDFMDLPIPASEEEKFDVVSLSLVLNYVPDVAQRGEMLRRTTTFLRTQYDSDINAGEASRGLPLLFIVLPLPCLINSRYMTHDHFIEILASLGYTLSEHHDSQKLTYMLFLWTKPTQHTNESDQPRRFKKIQINPGRSRNNFAIVLEPTSTLQKESRRTEE